MEIKPPSNELYTTITRRVPHASQNNLPSTPADWKVSQIIQATVTKITDKQLLLDIQGVKTNTPKLSNLDLQVGDILKLQIEQLKPLPQFRIIRFQSIRNVNLTNQTLKNILSQSSSLIPLLKNLSFVASRPALRPSPLSAETNAAVRDMFKQLPSVFNLKTAQQVKNHIQNSGLYIESKIKNAIISSIQQIQLNKITRDKALVNIKPLLESDLGAQLHRLANLVKTQMGSQQNTAFNKPSPPQVNRPSIEQASLQNISHRDEAMQTFLRQIESSLTHMQQTQLQNLSESQANRPLWLMELPIKNGQEVDLFELKISQDETYQDENDDKKIWNVTLKFDLNGLGKIKVHIKMQNEYISAQFYSDKREVLSLFRENFSFLRRKLNSSGLHVGNIECTQAKLSSETPSSTKTEKPS